MIKWLKELLMFPAKVWDSMMYIEIECCNCKCCKDCDD